LKQVYTMMHGQKNIRLFASFAVGLSLFQKNIFCAAIANETYIKINSHRLNVHIKLKLLDHCM